MYSKLTPLIFACFVLVLSAFKPSPKNLTSSELNSCGTNIGSCFTDSCIMDFAQNTYYFVVWVDCGTETYRYESTGCIGPSIFDYCVSPIFWEY